MATKTRNDPDRTQPPPVKEVEKAGLVKPEFHRLSNGMPCYEIRAGEVDVVKAEFVFHAGEYYQDKPLIANATGEMLMEGTRSYSSRALHQQMERYGVEFEVHCDRDLVSLELHALNRHLPKVLPIIREMLTEPVFPEAELAKYLAEEKHHYEEDRQRVSYLCRQAFVKTLFGTSHPYGNVIRSVEDFDNVTREELVAFHQKHYQPANGTLLLSGRTSDRTLQVMDEYFGDIPFGEPVPQERQDVKMNPSPERKHFEEKPDALQYAIRMGKPLFNKTHPDHYGFQVLNTLLGGYFGSRLMSNIREEKGYTYGIGSGAISLLRGGYFVITTEVGAQVKDPALTEIYKEIDRLREEKVDPDELDRVRNYMSGALLRGADGPFAIAELFKGVHFFGLEMDHFDRLLETVHSITPEEVRDLAVKYLDPSTLYQVLAGPGGHGS